MIFIIIFLSCFVAVLSWKLYDSHIAEKLLKNERENKIHRKFIKTDITRITEEYAEYISNVDFKIASSYGCLVKLQLDMKDGISIRLLCSEIEYLIVDDLGVNKERHCNDTMKAYIKTHCNNVTYLKNYRRHGWRFFIVNFLVYLSLK